MNAETQRLSVRVNEPLIDVRSEADFLAGHPAGAVGIPLEELARRAHELPRQEVALAVFDEEPGRAEQAVIWLRKRGHIVTVAAGRANDAPSERGPSRVRLWEPNPFLVEALDRIGAARSPSDVAPRAVDVACGSGRDAVYLATRGYAVDAIDLLPDALERAGDLARRSAVPIRTTVQDLQSCRLLPAARYDLVVVCRFLQRSLFPALRSAVAPGGYVAYETFHERNRQAGQRPQSPAHLLQTGELVTAFYGFDVLIARDEIERDGRFFSQLLAKRR